MFGKKDKKDDKKEKDDKKKDDKKKNDKQSTLVENKVEEQTTTQVDEAAKVEQTSIQVEE